MADDSISVNEPLDFHPTSTPRGTMYYNLEELTDSQKTQLNALKINTIRENEKYLAAHPEIRAIIVLLLRTLLRHRPMLKIHEFIAKFFNRNESDIEDEVYEYLATRKDHVYEDLSAVNIALKRKPAVEKESTIDRPFDFICGEECICDHALQWKLSEYTKFDDISFSETEHWLTPKSSRTSISLGDTQPEATEEEFSLSQQLAQIVDLVGADEEQVTDAAVDIEDVESFVMDNLLEEDSKENADQAKDELSGSKIITSTSDIQVKKTSQAATGSRELIADVSEIPPEGGKIVESGSVVDIKHPSLSSVEAPKKETSTEEGAQLTKKSSSAEETVPAKKISAEEPHLVEVSEAVEAVPNKETSVEGEVYPEKETSAIPEENLEKTTSAEVEAIPEKVSAEGEARAPSEGEAHVDEKPEEN